RGSKKRTVVFILLMVFALVAVVVASREVLAIANRPTGAPSTNEMCTLYYLDGTALAEGRPFSLWCPTTGWVPLSGSQNP
ncbi:MAG: hypothetical protein Q8L46_01840, partial [candidate division WWE3 bacterium]|nr:hypothetical protein [candidate division WWE3 bacterium]